LTPVRALDGSYKVEMESETYVVFRFVEGTVPGIEGMSQEQTIELAEILALLHESTVESTDKYPGLNEDISLPFCLRLQEYLQQPHPGATELSDVVLPHTQTLQQAIETALLLRDRHRTDCDKLVFCHGDAHGNNVIQSDRLVLVDWEDLRLAPVEADLFIYAWHPFGNVLLQAYSHAHKGYQVNSELLHFYVLRRRLEDLWVDIQRFTEESPSQEEKTTLLRWIEIGLGKVISLV
ncbi:MAG: phosphotransferase, partial [Symbiobacteriaceae bacterium]|nr:phosphotransferase [Symbiobacteriaceae bacterium]